ncbi:Uncharacterised protein [Mycobacterium tuberculosis]|nr:Uncharacterised protein [Mycobacterium tuberculosis]
MPLQLLFFESLKMELAMSQLQKRNQTQPLPSLNIKMKLLTLHIKT